MRPARSRASAAARSPSIAGAETSTREVAWRCRLSDTLSSTAASGGLTADLPASKENSSGTPTSTAPSSPGATTTGVPWNHCPSQRCSWASGGGAAGAGADGWPGHEGAPGPGPVDAQPATSAAASEEKGSWHGRVDEGGLRPVEAIIAPGTGARAARPPRMRGLPRSVATAGGRQARDAIAGWSATALVPDVLSGPRHDRFLRHPLRDTAAPVRPRAGGDRACVAVRQHRRTHQRHRLQGLRPADPRRRVREGARRRAPAGRERRPGDRRQHGRGHARQQGRHGALPHARRGRARDRPRARDDRQLQVGGDRGRPQVHPGQGHRQFHLAEGGRRGVPPAGEARAPLRRRGRRDGVRRTRPGRHLRAQDAASASGPTGSSSTKSASRRKTSSSTRTSSRSPPASRSTTTTRSTSSRPRAGSSSTCRAPRCRAASRT